MIKWLQGTYNGLYKIVLEPFTPRRKMILMLVFAMILGLIIGYGIDPIQFYDGDPRTLGQSWQDEWVRLLADRNAANVTANPDVNQNIVERLAAVDDPVGIVDRLLANAADPSDVNKLTAIRPFAELAQPVAAAAPSEPSFIRSLLPWILGPIIAAVLVVIWSWAWSILIKNWLEPIFKRLRGEKDSEEVIQMRARVRAQQIADTTQRSDFVKTDLGPPLMQRMSTFQLGYGQYDDSFSIEDEQERFLGECGSSISETIGTGSPDKPTAVEVWLFDKDDYVRTITNVFMSEHAYNDPALRAKLETKGDLILAKVGTVAILETGSLRLQARIVDIQYGTGNTPPNSFFEKLTIELAGWRRTGVNAGGATPVPVIAAPAPLPYAPPMTPAPAPLPYTPPPIVTQPPAAPTFTPPPPTFAPAPYQPAPMSSLPP
ncbi:MAG: hypothetical protein SGI73_00235, partial [Chloroflexota bacterium]|nr:hypothetical protein [Chloroflexota bacterium]